MYVCTYVSMYICTCNTTLYALCTDEGIVYGGALGDGGKYHLASSVLPSPPLNGNQV